ATMYNYNMILSSSDQNKDKELQLINTMLEKQVDGIVFVRGTVTKEQVDEFETSHVPVVLAATQDITETIPSVNIDSEEARYEAKMYLNNKHSSVPAFMKGKDNTIISDYKLKGYKRALKESDLEWDESYVVEGNYSYDSGI